MKIMNSKGRFVKLKVVIVVVAYHSLLTWHDVWRDEERDPRDDDEQPGREVVGDDVGHDVSPEIHLEASQRVVAQGPGQEDAIRLLQVVDLDVVVQHDALLLNEGQVRDAEQHPGHVVRVGADLKKGDTIY